MVLPFSLHLPFLISFSLMTSFCPSSSIFSHQIHCCNHRGRYQKPSTTSHHLVVVWSILWQERVVPIVHAHLTLNLDSSRLQLFSSSNFRVDQTRNIIIFIFVLICLWMIFFFIFLNNLEFVVFGDYWALFLWFLFFGIDFMVMVGQQFNA